MSVLAAILLIVGISIVIYFIYDKKQERAEDIINRMR